MKITLRQLEVFVAIAHHGQVTRAAGAVALTQGAASMAISDLEQQLGARLFDRVGKQLILNETGRLLLGRAQEVLDRVGDIEALASGRESVFDIRLGASVTIGNHLLPALVAGMRQRYPNARIHILRYNTEQVLAHLLDFSIEVGFVEGPVEDARFHSFAWQQDQLALFGAPDSPLARRGRALKPADLAGADWVMRESGSGTRKVFERACAEHGIEPRLALELEQPEAIRQCVRAGLGYGCLSLLELQEAFKAGTLARLKAPFLDLRRDLAVVINRRKFISQGISTILEECGIAV